MATQSVKEVLFRFDDKVMNDIRARMVATNAVATGATYNSLRSEESENRATLFGAEGFINDAIQKGSPAGTLVNLDKMIAWCNARGISAGRAKRIVKNIYARGTITVNKSRPRDIYDSIITREAINNLIADITGVQRSNVMSEIVNEFKK